MAAADDVVVLDFADERSVVQTRFATTALTLLRAHLGLHTDAVVADAAHRAGRRRCPKGSSSARSSPSSAGAGPSGLANEAALKMREASLAWTEAYPAMEYRHGPISVTTRGTATWMLGEAPEGLAEQVRATGGQWVAGRARPARRTGPRPAPRRRRRRRPAASTRTGRATSPAR